MASEKWAATPHDVASGSVGRRAAKTGGLAALYAVLFLVLASGKIPCSFASLTHRPCPGCGTTRSALALFHGDLATAFRFNPLGPIVIVAMGVLAIDSLRHMARDGDLRRFADSKLTGWALRILLGASLLQIVVWVARFFGYLGGPVPVG